MDTKDSDGKPVMQHTPSSLGLPWRLVDHEDGYEINCSPVGWLFRLDDTTGNHPRDDDPSFREAQREHADFLIKACNQHHDLLSIAKRWAALDGGSWHADRHAAEKAELRADTRAAIAKAEGR